MQDIVSTQCLDSLPFNRGDKNRTERTSCLICIHPADRLGEPHYRWYVPLWRGMRALMEAQGRQCGLLGTVTSVIGGQERPVERTTSSCMPRSCLETCSHTWPTRTATIFEGRKRTALCKECRPPRPDRHDFSGRHAPDCERVHTPGC